MDACERYLRQVVWSLIPLSANSPEGEVTSENERRFSCFSIQKEMRLYRPGLLRCLFFTLLSGDRLDIQSLVPTIRSKVTETHKGFSLIEVAIRDDIDTRLEIIWSFDSLVDRPVFRRRDRYHPYQRPVNESKETVKCVDCSALDTGCIPANSVFRHILDANGNLFLNGKMRDEVKSLALPEDTHDHLVMSISRFNLFMEFDTPENLLVEVEVAAPYIFVYVRSFFRCTSTQWESVIQYLVSQNAYRNIQVSFHSLLIGNRFEFRLQPNNRLFDS
jgi:hypothetical protein